MTETVVNSAILYSVVGAFAGVIYYLRKEWTWRRAYRELRARSIVVGILWPVAVPIVMLLTIKAIITGVGSFIQPEDNKDG